MAKVISAAVARGVIFRNDSTKSVFLDILHSAQNMPSGLSAATNFDISCSTSEPELNRLVIKILV
jgi:hypothetical protein